MIVCFVCDVLRCDNVRRSPVIPQAVGVTDWGPLCQGEQLDEFTHDWWVAEGVEGVNKVHCGDWRDQWELR